MPEPVDHLPVEVVLPALQAAGTVLLKQSSHEIAPVTGHEAIGEKDNAGGTRQTLRHHFGIGAVDDPFFGQNGLIMERDKLGV